MHRYEDASSLGGPCETDYHASREPIAIPGVISELFRTFQAAIRTSGDWRAYRAGEARMPNEKERAICHWHGWPGCGNVGPDTSDDPVWAEDSTVDCGRAVGTAGLPGRPGHLPAGGGPALLHRELIRCCLLPRGQPQVGFSGGASAGVRADVWRRGRTGHGPRRTTAVGAPRSRSVHPS